MAKHRKTLQQKKIADLRHKFYSLDQAQLGFDRKDILSLKTKTFSEIKNDSISLTTATTTANKYPYLINDILKTGILTGLILIVQIILFFLLKNHILVLPMVKY